MKRINILILTTSLHVGGAEKHIYNLVSGLDERSYKLVIVCLYELGQLGEMLSGRKQTIEIYHNVMKNKLDIRGAIRLTHIMRDNNIDILFMVHTPLTIFWGIICAKLAGVRVSISRSPTTNPSSHVKRWKLVNLVMLRFIDRIIAQAYSQKEYLINELNVDSRKITVIYNGVDVGVFSKSLVSPIVRKELGIPSSVPVVSIVGRLAPQKGHSVFLRAARTVLDSFPDVHFLIVGDGKERLNLEQLTKDLLIQKNVYFLGTVNNVARIISIFDIGVLSSRPIGETFSNAILEYMAASKPVVATNVGSIAEQVKNGETGYLVPYNNPDALAEALMKLLRNRSEAEKMGAAGRAMVDSQFTVQKMIGKYESLFVELIT